MKVLILLSCLVGCESRIEHAESLVDDGDYVEARAVLAHESCVARSEALRCALAFAIVADGVGDRVARDAWIARCRLLAQTQRVGGIEQARLNALDRRVLWERQVDRAIAGLRQ